MTTAEIVRIPFHNTEVLAVEENGNPFVLLRPAVESLGLDYSTQLAKLKGRSWACVGQSPMQLPGDLQRRSYTTVDVRTFLMLLATINENNVAEGLRSLLIAYQAEVADVIERHFTNRVVAPAPQAIPSHAEALRGWAAEIEVREQAEAEREEAMAQVAELEPKAELADRYLDSEGGDRLVGQAAKLFGLREKDLRRFLLAEKLLFVRHSQCGTPQYEFYAAFAGSFVVREKVVEHTFGTCSHYTVRITPKGMDLVRRRLRGSGLTSIAS